MDRVGGRGKFKGPDRVSEEVVSKPDPVSQDEGYQSQQKGKGRPVGVNQAGEPPFGLFGSRERRPFHTGQNYYAPFFPGRK